MWNFIWHDLDSSLQTNDSKWVDSYCDTSLTRLDQVMTRQNFRWLWLDSDSKGLWLWLDRNDSGTSLLSDSRVNSVRDIYCCWLLSCSLVSRIALFLLCLLQQFRAMQITATQCKQDFQNCHQRLRTKFEWRNSRIRYFNTFSILYVHFRSFLILFQGLESLENLILLSWEFNTFSRSWEPF